MYGVQLLYTDVLIYKNVLRHNIIEILLKVVLNTIKQTI